MRCARFSTVVGVCLVLVTSAARADEPEKERTVSFELAGDSVIVHANDAEKLVKVGCTPRSFASDRTMAYALCAPNIIVIVDALPDPHVVERRAIAASLVSVSVKDGVVLVRSDLGVKPLDEYQRGRTHGPVARTQPRYDYWTPPQGTARRAPKRKPAITGLEVGVLGTAGAGVDAVPGPFGLLDLSIIERTSVGLSLAAFGTFGAATGQFLNGSSATGPFGGDTQVVVGEALIGVDTRWFAFSVGTGAAMTDHGYDAEPLFVIRGRGGEVDGFNFTWHSSFVVSGPNAFGVMGGMLEFPVTRRLWLGTDAELGNLRYGRFMVDLRQRLSPPDQKATFDIRAGVGLAYIHSGPACTSSFGSNNIPQDTECFGTNANYLGPAVSLGLVWRP